MTDARDPAAAPALTPYAARIADFSAGRDTPRHFLERCLESIARLDPAVQAFVCLDMDGARRAADDASVRYRSRRPLSPIDGMPFGIKDIIETADLPTQMNSPIYTGFRPRRDAAAVGALKRAGAAILGKTATAEFACGRSPETRNPHDLARTPGGSSSGSAASVGGGMVPGALGTQTQASVLRPASYCGCYALKPSLGLLPLEGVTPLSVTLDHVGLFAASLADLWNTFSALAEGTRPVAGAIPGLGGAFPEASPPRTLIRLDTKGWQELDPASADAFEETVRRLQKLGVTVLSAASDPAIAALERDLVEGDPAAALIYAVEAQWQLRSYDACGERMVGARIHELLAAAAKASEDDYYGALSLRRRVIERVTELAARCDGFITLSASGPAIADIAYTGSRSFPVPWTFVGAPSLSLPLLSSGGLPLGLQVMTGPGQDARALRIARWIDDQFSGSAAQ